MLHIDHTYIATRSYWDLCGLYGIAAGSFTQKLVHYGLLYTQYMMHYVAKYSSMFLQKRAVRLLPSSQLSAEGR